MIEDRKSKFYSDSHSDWVFDFKQEINEFARELKESLTELKRDLLEEIALIREDIKDSCKNIFDDEEGGIIL